MGIDIPADAQSLALSFKCDGGGDFSVELGDSMMLGQSPLSGTCDGATELAWPITDETASTLSVTVPDGVEWVAVPSFSSDEFSSDPALEADCEQFSTIYSALVNADQGYTQYAALDSVEWETRIDDAAADLNTLSTSTTSGLGDALERILIVVTDPNRVTGAVLTVEAQAPIREISDRCAVNHTPLTLTAEFGG